MILTLEEWITKYCLVINSLESTNRGMLSLESTNRGMLSLESTNRGMLVRRLYVTATVSQWYDDLQATTRYYLIIYHSDTTTYRLPLGIIWLFITVIRRLTGYHSVLSDFVNVHWAGCWGLVFTMVARQHIVNMRSVRRASMIGWIVSLRAQ